MRKILGLLGLILLTGCQDATKQNVLQPGFYRVVLDVQDGQSLPFNIKVTGPQSLQIFNAEEVIEVDEISYRNDSVYITTPVFEGFFAAVFDGNHLKGAFIKESRDRKVPFRAEYDNNQRFPEGDGPEHYVSGVWEALFSPDTADDSYIAKGIFKQTGGRVTGTFRTTTGDYRYLEGVVTGDSLKLSTFDGAHAFLFVAKVTDSSMAGTFYSGNHFQEPFVAKRNPDYELPSADALTFLKEGYERLDFEFPDAQGNVISLQDKRFENKVVIVQVMGTWCPNCLDESKYYTAYYKANRHRGVEMVALAFEYAKTKNKAFEKIARLQDRLKIDYPILLAQYGGADKAMAQEKLPMLNHVLSYPTSIFIDKQAKVRKIHTGFNGPATGEKFTEFKAEFEDFIETLLKE